jgi:hypothetical protein
MLRGCLVVLWAGLSAAACGGEVKVDGDPRGATTGDSDDDGSDDGTSSGPSACLTAPEVSGTIYECAVGYEPGHCTYSRCTDDGQNSWNVLCSDRSCTCQWNDTDICTCTVSGGEGSICDGPIAPCCPEPWINP